MDAALLAHEENISLHSSSHELAALEIPNLDQQSASSTPVDVTGAILTVPAGDLRPYRVRFGGWLYLDSAVANGTLVNCYITLEEDGVEIARTGVTLRGVASPTPVPVTNRRGQRRRLPALVSHTYKMRMIAQGGIVHFLASPATATGFIQATTL